MRGKHADVKVGNASGRGVPLAASAMLKDHVRRHVCFALFPRAASRGCLARLASGMGELAA
ncbi:hypothetical protein [Parvibaculum sp.]|uniref:hypothetical protein n=1 Tax=Parvibaculum sp. TaxID=2024848 RepID=UPI002D0644BF|nr:hypothetical protein [Parvibaculum sp.]HUD53331.1 hypothetical protein [Parvibaculum sp.]